MNSSIKRRQTLLVNWLAKTLNCKPITIAQTGSYYTEFNTLYTGKSVIRISDHMSNDRTYIHVIMNPLNSIVTVCYKNFLLSGTFQQAKQTLYTLIMSKAMNEVTNPIPLTNTPVKVKKCSAVTPAQDGTTAITQSMYKNLTMPGKQFVQSIWGNTWKKTEHKKRRLTAEQYKHAQSLGEAEIVSFKDSSTAVSKHVLLRLSEALQKEVFNWKGVQTFEELPDVIALTEVQFTQIKKYL